MLPRRRPRWHVGSGAVKDFKTTVLMSPDAGFDAMPLAQGAGYRPPGA
jgi:hypothetical protein